MEKSYIKRIIELEKKESSYINRIKELEERIKDLELAFNSSYDGLHLIDCNGNTLLINDACGINEGLYRDEIQGKTIWQLIDEGYLSESVTLKVLEKKETVTMIQKVKNGKEMLVTGTPIYDEEGKITKVLTNSRDITELNYLKNKLCESRKLYYSTKHQLQRIINQNLSSHIVCKSPQMQKIINTALLVAEFDSNILITGESGTGKGVLSKFIHDKSKRAQAPFIKIDCGSIPESLFESEMFGYESGAFTGASSSGKIGLVELANGGTLFLDEVGELSLASQAKLLRVIQDKEILRVGGKETIKIDARIIAATNRNLEDMVKNKIFREDLYYRLNVIPIHIPPLRERPEDIQELIIQIVSKLCDKHSFKKNLDLSAMESLIEYPWEGNIRELENVLERILVTTRKETISKYDLQSYFNNSYSKQDSEFLEGDIRAKVKKYEAKILGDLIRKGKTPAEIAILYGAHVSTIRRKLNEYGIKFK